ncbi:MAG: hypothetical protein HUK40_19245 [Desulfobacter sp.]|nr:hypothetical protein [Desulfobacter sp.]
MNRRATVDRRVEDRRKGFDLEAISRLGTERRVKERRTQAEKRDGWVRVSKWSSIKLTDVAGKAVSFEVRL